MSSSFAIESLLSPGPVNQFLSKQRFQISDFRFNHMILVEADYSGFQFLQTGNLVLSASYWLAVGGSPHQAHTAHNLWTGSKKFAVTVLPQFFRLRDLL
jgi:hypothetical protein